MPTQDAEYFKLKEVAIDYAQSKPVNHYEVRVRLLLEPMEKPNAMD